MLLAALDFHLHADRELKTDAQGNTVYVTAVCKDGIILTKDLISRNDDLSSVNYVKSTLCVLETQK